MTECCIGHGQSYPQLVSIDVAPLTKLSDLLRIWLTNRGKGVVHRAEEEKTNIMEKEK